MSASLLYHEFGVRGYCFSLIVWKSPMIRARRLLAYLAANGWLSRIRRDAYTTLPLGASSPGEWREDPWLVAAKTFAPCYLGGWTACEHWGLTEQLFRDVVVVTAKRVRHRREEIQGTKYRIKVVAAERIFGTRNVWRAERPVPVSDPTRTMLDLLDDPALGGGMRNVADMARNWFSGEHRRDAELLDYAARLGNRTVYKRLGFLLEALPIDAPVMLDQCRARMSTGISLLDPSAKPLGRITKRWTVWMWGVGVPIETIRFAAANHLCLELGYQGTQRRIEPYSFRRTKRVETVIAESSCVVFRFRLPSNVAMPSSSMIVASPASLRFAIQEQTHDQRFRAQLELQRNRIQAAQSCSLSTRTKTLLLRVTRA